MATITGLASLLVSEGLLASLVSLFFLFITIVTIFTIFRIFNSLPHFDQNRLSLHKKILRADSVVENPQGLSDWYWNHGGRSRCKQV